MRTSKLVASQYLGKVLLSGGASYGIKAAGVLVAFFVLTQPTVSIAQNVGRLIPSGQCAVIVMASKDTQMVLESIRKFQDIAPTPLAVESNNGFFAAALGVFSKADGAAFIKTNLSAGRLPKDAYCGNTERYVRLIYPTADFSAFVDKQVNVASKSTATASTTPDVAKSETEVTNASSAQVAAYGPDTSPPVQPQQNPVAVATNVDSSSQSAGHAPVAPDANPGLVTPTTSSSSKAIVSVSPAPASAAVEPKKSSIPKLSKPTIDARRAQGEEISLEEEAVFFVAGGFNEELPAKISVDGCKASLDLYTHELMPQSLLQFSKDYRKEAAVLRVTTDYNKANWKSLRFKVFLNGSAEFQLDCAVDCREFVVYEDIRTEFDRTSAASLRSVAALILKERNVSAEFESGIKSRLEKAFAVVQKACPGVTTRF